MQSQTSSWGADLSRVSGRPVASAVVRLYTDSGAVTGGEFFASAATVWSEPTVTWNNAPVSIGAAVAVLGLVGQGAWYEIDVTPLVPSDGSLTIRVSTSSAYGQTYRSSEFNGGSHAPTLVVTLG